MSKTKGKSEIEKIESKLRKIEEGKYTVSTADIIKLQNKLLELKGK